MAPWVNVRAGRDDAIYGARVNARAKRDDAIYGARVNPRAKRDDAGTARCGLRPGTH